MNGWMIVGWVNGWTDRWTGGQVDEWMIDGWADSLTATTHNQSPHERSWWCNWFLPQRSSRPVPPPPCSPLTADSTPQQLLRAPPPPSLPTPSRGLGNGTFQGPRKPFWKDGQTMPFRHSTEERGTCALELERARAHIPGGTIAGLQQKEKEA